MDSQEVHASVLINTLPDIGPARFQALIEKFGSAREAVKRGIEEWMAISSFDREMVQQIQLDFQEALRRADEDLRLIEKFKIQVFLIQQGPYPRLLKEIFHAPPIIYALGEDIVVERPAVALVGSRRCSYYGEKMAGRLAAELSVLGVTTVSGLARGIDTHVHRASLNAGGKTWAVVGSGLSVLYPPENRELAKAIENSGAIISEFPMSMRPYPANFPRRNRIIAGLSIGTVLVEGDEKSGALITARLAADEGRDVFAVPGPVTSNLSTAPHRLLRLGAKMVESAQDIIEEFSKTDREKLFFNPSYGLQREVTPEEYQDILSLIGAEPLSRDALAGRLKQETQHVNALLLEMELKGLIKSIPGGMVLKN